MNLGFLSESSISYGIKTVNSAAKLCRSEKCCGSEVSWCSCNFLLLSDWKAPLLIFVNSNPTSVFHGLFDLFFLNFFFFPFLIWQENLSLIRVPRWFLIEEEEKYVVQVLLSCVLTFPND